MYQGLDGNWYDDNGQQVPDPSTSGGGPPPSTAQPATDPNAITRQQVLDAYYAFTGRTPEQISEEEIQGAMHHPGGIGALSTFMANSPEGQAYTHRDRGTGGTGGTPPPGGGTPPPGAWDFHAPPPSWDFGAWSGGAPGFTPPTYEKPPAFVDPDYASVVGKDPGYLFELNAGVGALEHSRAAAGTLNGGGTLMDVNAWGQNYAATRVNDARNRAKDTYLTNYATQYMDPYKYQYQAALDSFLGRNSQWQTQGQVGQRQNETDWMHAYTPWNDTWNRRVQVDLS